MKVAQQVLKFASAGAYFVFEVVINLPQDFNKTWLKYCFIEQNNQKIRQQEKEQIDEVEVIKNFHNQTVSIFNKHIKLNAIQPDQNLYLYIELWAKSKQNYLQEFIPYSWTLLELFDHSDNILIGQYYLQFYSMRSYPWQEQNDDEDESYDKQQLQTNNEQDQYVYPKLFIQVCFPEQEQKIQKKDKYFGEDEQASYNLPNFHQKYNFQLQQKYRKNKLSNQFTADDNIQIDRDQLITQAYQKLKKKNSKKIKYPTYKKQLNNRFKELKALEGEESSSYAGSRRNIRTIKTIKYSDINLSEKEGSQAKDKEEEESQQEIDNLDNKDSEYEYEDNDQNEDKNETKIKQDKKQNNQVQQEIDQEQNNEKSKKKSKQAKEDQKNVKEKSKKDKQIEIDQQKQSQSKTEKNLKKDKKEDNKDIKVDKQQQSSASLKKDGKKVDNKQYSKKELEMLTKKQSFLQQRKLLNKFYSNLEKIQEQQLIISLKQFSGLQISNNNMIHNIQCKIYIEKKGQILNDESDNQMEQFISEIDFEIPNKSTVQLFGCKMYFDINEDFLLQYLNEEGEGDEEEEDEDEEDEQKEEKEQEIKEEEEEEKFIELKIEAKLSQSKYLFSFKLTEIQEKNHKVKLGLHQIHGYIANRWQPVTLQINVGFDTPIKDKFTLDDCLLLSIKTLKNYNQLSDIIYKIQVYEGNQLMNDLQMQKIKFRSNQSYEPDLVDKSVYINQEYPIFLNAALLKSEKQDILDRIYFIIEFYKIISDQEIPLGWYKFYLFSNKSAINLGEIQCNLYKYPIILGANKTTEKFEKLPEKLTICLENSKFNY